MSDTTNITMQLKYGSPKHKAIVKALQERQKLSWNKMAEKRERMSEDERAHRAYLRTDELLDTEVDSRDTRNVRDRHNKTREYQTIEVPYTYGLLMAYHTYMATVFLSKKPTFQFAARHGETPQSEQALESLIDYQTSVGGNLSKYFIWLLDSAKYGLGVIGTYWATETTQTSRIMEEQEKLLGIPFGPKRRVKKTVTVPGFEGNRVFNVRPQNWLPDPRVNIADFQDGEFCGRIFDIGWLTLWEGALDGTYIKENVEYVRKKSAKYSEEEEDKGFEQVIRKSDSDDGQTITNPDGLADVGTLKGVEMFVKIVPQQWGLGKSEFPELWAFVMVADVLMSAKPLGELHGKFPFDAIEYEIEGHQLYKRSMYELLEPLSDTLTWLVNSHFFNVRKSLNNMFIYDPSRVNAPDFRNPEAGLAIRLKPNAYGTPIDNMFRQLPVSDVTRSNLQDTQVVIDLMQRMVGINDQLMGGLQNGGRKTATEVRGSTGFSMNRLKTHAEYISATGFGPHTAKLVQSTQQHYDLDKYFRLVGDLGPSNASRIKVTPEDIAGGYDYIPVDGTAPVDNFALANLWREMMVGIQSIPEIQQDYDMSAIFAYVAQLSGVKNVNKFKVQFSSPEDIEAKRAQGALVPLTGNDNVLNPLRPNNVPTAPTGPATTSVSTGSANPAGDDQNAGRTLEPTQISGVGPVS